MKKHIITSLCLLLLAAGCNQADKEEISNSRAITFTTSYGSTRATETSFEQNDEISVFAFKSEDKFAAQEFYASNIKYIYNNRFEADNAPIYYPDNTPLAFYAIYPYIESAGENFTFQVADDQNSAQSYTKSDLMTASTAMTTDVRPALQFAHRMSNILVDISNEWEGFSISSIELCNMNTTVSAHLANNSFETIGSSTKNIKAYYTEGVYKAVVPSQTQNTENEFIKINGRNESGEVTLNWKLKQNATFNAGMRYEYKLHIDKSGKVGLEDEIIGEIIVPEGKTTIDRTYKIEAKIIENPNNIAIEKANIGWFQITEFTKDGIVRIYADQTVPESEWFEEGSDSVFTFAQYYYFERINLSNYMLWGAYEEGYWEEAGLTSKEYVLGELPDSFTSTELDDNEESPNKNGIIWEVTYTRLKDFNGLEYYKDRKIRYEAQPTYPRPAYPSATKAVSSQKQSQSLKSMHKFLTHLKKRIS